MEERIKPEAADSTAPDSTAARPDEPPSAPASNSFSARLAATRERVTTSLDSARGRSRIVDAASTILLRPRLVADTVLAGYLAMRLFILLFPLAYMAVAGLGLYERSNGPAEEVATDAGLAPAVTASIVDAASSSSRNHWIALLIGLAGTVWAARGVLRALRAMHALAWGMPAPKTGFKPLGPLLTAVTVVALALAYTISDSLQDRRLGWVAAHVVGVLAVSGIWLAASLLLPRLPTRWVALVPGALLFGVGLEGLNLATAIYFAPKASTASAAYGVLGVGLVLLSWLIVVGWVVILAAEVNAGLHEWWHRKGSPEQRDPDDGSAVAGTDGASAPPGA